MLHRWICALALLAAGCNSYTPPALPTTPSPTATTPARLVLLASSRTDQQLDVSAQVLTSDGHGVPNIAVTFALTGGAVTPATVTTDATGWAKAVAIGSGTATLTATTATLHSSATVIGGATSLSVSLIVPSVIVNATSAFSASVSGSPIGGPFTFAWTYGDGVSESGGASTITHKYAATGTYQASVVVKDGAGRSATGLATAIVSDPPAPPPPAPPAPAPTLSVTLTCTGNTHATPSPCNVSATYGGVQLASTAITSAVWDFGDGSTQTILNSPLASKAYAQAGVYVVTATVTATTIDGAKTASASKSITVN